MILLDTHTWLWLYVAPDRLSSAATGAIRRAVTDGGIAVASISLLEMAMMVARGIFQPRDTPEAWLTGLVERTGVVVKEITPAVATLAIQFPRDFPGDPADRLIAATARAEGLPLVTRDRNLRKSRLIETVW